jgi:hypothetical protein
VSSNWDGMWLLCDSDPGVRVVGMVCAIMWARL